MVVIKAKSMGFCKGARDSIKGVKDLIVERKQISVFGELLHNKKVIDNLKKIGIGFVEPNPDVVVKGKLVIRAHGISNALMKKLKEKNDVIDLTCPKVYKIHALANFYEKKGYHIVYLGKANHPEAEGTLGNLKNYTLVTNLNDAKQIKKKKIAFIAMSTCQISKFNEIANYFKENKLDPIIINTICESTRAHQDSAKKLSEKSDVMVIIGGKQSSNTKELFELCKKITPSIWLENPEEIKKYECLIKNAKTVGLTAGASTPDEDIEELFTLLEVINNKRA